MDPNSVTQIMNETFQWMDLISLVPRKTMQSHLNVYLHVEFVYIQLIIIKCLYALYCYRKMHSKVATCILSVPTMVNLYSAVDVTGLPFDKRYLLIWWPAAVFMAYYVSSVLSFYLLVSSAIQWGLCELAVDMFIAFSVWRVLQSKRYDILKRSEHNEAFVLISVALVITIMCNVTGFLNELFAVLVIITIVYRMACLYFLEMSTYYFSLAVSCFLCEIFATVRKNPAFIS